MKTIKRFFDMLIIAGKTIIGLVARPIILAQTVVVKMLNRIPVSEQEYADFVIYTGGLVLCQIFHLPLIIPFILANISFVITTINKWSAKRAIIKNKKASIQEKFTTNVRKSLQNLKILAGLDSESKETRQASVRLETMNKILQSRDDLYIFPQMS